MSHPPTFKVLVADDEVAGRNYIVALLNEDERFQIESLCDSGAAAIEAYRKSQPNVLFLDIRMPDGDGFEVLQALAEQQALVVFVTGFSDYALKAYEREVFDYIKKPITPKRFRRVLDRVYARLLEQRQIAGEQNSSSVREQKLLRTVDGDIVYLESEIQCVESADNYIRVLVGNKIHLVRTTLTKFYEQLSSNDFLRVHRSFIVNLNWVRKIHRMKGLLEITVANGRCIPVGPTWRDETMRVLRTRYGSKFEPLD